MILECTQVIHVYDGTKVFCFIGADDTEQLQIRTSTAVPFRDGLAYDFSASEVGMPMAAPDGCGPSDDDLASIEAQFADVEVPAPRPFREGWERFGRVLQVITVLHGLVDELVAADGG